MTIIHIYDTPYKYKYLYIYILACDIIRHCILKSQWWWCAHSSTPIWTTNDILICKRNPGPSPGTHLLSTNQRDIPQWSTLAHSTSLNWLKSTGSTDRKTVCFVAVNHWTVVQRRALGHTSIFTWKRWPSTADTLMTIVESLLVKVSDSKLQVSCLTPAFNHHLRSKNHFGVWASC